MVDLAFSPDGATLAVNVSGGRIVRVIDAATGSERGILSGHSGGVMHVAFAPREALVVASDHDGTVRAWDSMTLAPRWTINGERGTSLRGVSRDATRVLTTGPGVVSAWNRETGVRTVALRPHADRPVHASFALDDTVVLTASEGRLRLWDVRPSPAAQWEVVVEEQIPGSIHDVALQRLGRRLAVVHTSGAVWMLDAESGVVMWRARTGRDVLPWVQFSPDDALLMSRAGQAVSQRRLRKLAGKLKQHLWGTQLLIGRGSYRIAELSTFARRSLRSRLRWTAFA